jgi:tetratricopeptide (TPR) repeat protein
LAIDNLKKRLWLTQAFIAVVFSYQFVGGSCEIAAFADAGQVIALNNDGVKALNTGNFQQAIFKFEAALKLDPNYQMARDNLAIAHNNYGLQLRNNPKEALKQFHMALYLNRTNATTMQNVEGIIRMMGKNPRSFKDRVQLGDEARLSGDFVGALIEYSEACKIQDDPALHVKMGDIYRVRDENDKAINEYQQASKLKDSAEIEVKLGQAFQAKKDVPNAIAAYGAALKFNNSDPDVLDALVAGWEEALKENPLAPENHIGLGQAFAYRGDFGQSAEEYKQAIRLSPGRRNPTAERLLAGLAAMQKDSVVNKHVNVGLDLQTKKMYPQAINEYKIALQADPQNDTVWVNLGTAYQAMEDFDNALSCYKQALKINAQNAAAQQGIQTASAAKQDKVVTQSTEAGAALFKQGQYDAAIAKYQEVLKLTPNDASTWFDMGATYQAKKDYDNAIGCYDKAIGFDPKNASYPKAREGALDAKAQPIIDAAIAKHGQKDYAAAIPLYQKALSIRPNNASLWFNLASAQYASQNYLDARESYQKALMDRKGQIGCMYLIATIDENYGKGAQALGEYQKYLAEAPNGPYAQAAKDRVAALSKNPSDIVKIKSETELAAIKRASDAYDQAVKYQNSKNFAAAEPLYLEAIQLQPQNPDYVYGLGTLYQIMEQLGKAIVQYQKALQLEPNNKDYANALQAAVAGSVDPIIDQAVQKQTSGDLPGAILLYKQAIAQAPMVARAHTDLGTAYQQTDDYVNARKEYAEGYRLDPKNEVGDLYLMGPLDENSNQGAQALSEYQRYLKEAPSGQYAAVAKGRVAALQKNPGDLQKLSTRAEAQGLKDAEDAYLQAVKLQESTKYDDAIPLYTKATTMQPKNDAYAYAFGTCYQAKGDIANAITWYQKAIQLNPSNKDYAKVLMAAKGASAAPKMDDAVKKQQSGDNAGAIVLYKEALAADPDNARGWTNLGSAYQANDQFAEARQSYQKALDLDKKGEVFNYYYIGLLDENAGQAAKAIQDYQSYIQADPRGQFAGQSQGRISTLKANPSSTQKITTAAENKKSGEGQDAYNEGVKLQGENKYDEAIVAYKKALQASPNEAAYWYAMGTAYQAKNDLDGALENYKKAMAINPKEPAYKSAIRTVAQAKAAPLVNSAIEKQTKKNDIPGAIADYEAALRIDPDDAGTHMNLGTAYQAGNKNEKAAAEYRRAIQLDPKNADAHYFLATVLEALNQKPQAIKEYEDYLRLAPTGSYANDIRARLKLLRGR